MFLKQAPKLDEVANYVFILFSLHDLFMLPPPFNMLFSSRPTQNDAECFKNRSALKLYSHS